MVSIQGGSLVLFSTESAESDVDLVALVERYSPLLFRVAHSILRSRAEAEDVVQEVFVRVIERRGSLKAIQDMRVWLVRIAWNLALDRRRRIRPEQIDENFAETLAASAVPADERLEQAQRMGSVLREMERLPRSEHHVLLLSAIEELGTTAMAEILGRSESAVRALLFRARTRLRERLETRGGER
ncbi:MAG: sigma-70 family RNA polymerase sigma factor [Terracidiphilus sp.]|jgi:RNA polymerase sigma-70 factor (ECF subfamily)